MMFAVAQKRYLYIYDHSGMELHCLKQHSHINTLTFLPYHFLLVSAVSHWSQSSDSSHFGYGSHMLNPPTLCRMTMALYATWTLPLGKPWPNTERTLALSSA